MGAFVAVAMALLGSFSRSAHAQSTELSSDQLSQIFAQLEELRMIVDGRNTELNRSAASVFSQAAGDPKAAVALYAKCYREVNFVREGREESEYRDWEDNQKETFRDERFLEGLMVQLRYLALSCEAAEGKDPKDLFPAILSFVDSLSSLSELPSQQLLQGVNGSVFAKAYKIEDLLQKNNERWEMIPINIPGIYEKAVLPYLREHDPGNLMVAWDRRIEQETRMAQFFSSLEEKGSNRDERRNSENQSRQLQQGRSGNLIRSYDEDDFLEKTLPMLQWNRLRDMALYVDSVQGVSGLLTFVRERTEHPMVSNMLDDLTKVIEEIAARQAVADSTAAPVETPPAETGPASGNQGPGVANGIPVGLE